MIVDATVVLGLLAAISWGTGDFGGGIAGRRAPVFGVVIVSQAIGSGLALVLFLVHGEPWPSGGDLGMALVGGISGGLGLSALYQGLATGRMGVVAPISGVLAAAIPVVTGIVLQGTPSVARVLGIGMAFLAVVLVSRAPGARAGRSDVGLGLAAGLAIGVFNVAVSRFSPGAVFGPLVVTRASDAVFLLCLVGVARRPWRVGRPTLPIVAAVGLLDMAGNAFYITATQTGRLDVAAILSSLYPVTTLVLAAIILRERVRGAHLAGVLAAVAAIVLIGART